MSITGSPWQDVLGHRIELADVPAAAPGLAAYWDSARWGEGTWSAGWAPPFRDVTPDCLHAHVTAGAVGLDLAAGVGSVEVELLDLAGAYAPKGSTDWLLGRHLRGFVTPAGRPEAPLFYGIVDKAVAGGTFAVPVVHLTAYDVRALIAGAASTALVGNVAQTATVRLAAICAAANLPAAAVALEDDPTPLLADDTAELGDLYDRTVESAAGISWGDATGRVVYRNQGWPAGTGAPPVLYVYAGTPPAVEPAGTPVAPTVGDLDLTESFATVQNYVTYANFAEPPVEVLRQDLTSIRRYGFHRASTTDLACDVGVLTVLADRALGLRKDPVPVCEGATVTVYDASTARAAAVAIGDTVVVGRNDPGVAVWEIPGLVVGLEVDVAPDRFDVGITVLRSRIVAGAAAGWDSARWDLNRWGATPPTTVWTLGPDAHDRLDAGNVMGGAAAKEGPRDAA